MVAGDPARCRRNRELVVDLVHPEVVELREHGRKILAVAFDVAPPGRALRAGPGQELGHAVARVVVDGMVGHLEVEP